MNNEMKRIYNILSYWWLLLLLMVAACSDWEEPAQPMIDDEETGEVELTIQTQVPGMEGASRAISTEKITSITALAFDRDTTLIKVVSAEITPPQEESKKDTTGIFSVKVPLRTRSIHFIAKRDGDFTEITTETDYGKKAKDLLIDRTSDELHYWAMLEFENGEDLKDLSDELGVTGGKLDLIRNFAKVKLNLSNDMNGHIAGFLNYNVTGTIVPSKDGAFGYQTQTNHAMPPTFYIKSDTIDRELDTEYYLFEEKNVKGDDGFGVASDLVYTICKIDSLYYKIAFKSDSVFRPIIRNQVYNITISKDIDKTRGKTDYKEAVNAKPVNDAGAKLQIHMDFDPSVVFMFLDEVYSVTVANIDSIQTLQIGYSQDFFGQGGIAIEGITPTSQATATTSGEKTIWVDTYSITDKSGFTFTIDLDSTKVTTAAKDIEVQFLGEGENVYMNDILTVHALEQGDLTTVSPTAIEIPKTVGSTFTAQVTIPTYNEDVGDFELWVGDTEGAFTVTPPDDLKLLADGYYDVTEGQTYEFTFTLNEEGEIDAVKKVVFYVVTDYHRLVGTTTVTLLDDTVPEQDTYELWVENGAWNGSTGYNQFFDYPESITTVNAANLESTFYDDGANAHKSYHMVMGEGSSISFTISEQRYLTLLVAKNGNNTPSIKLMQEKTEWTKTDEANATTVEGTYNFGNGEIGTNGRLIRYQLPAGTYTLQGSAAEYLLYYMRVTKVKPEMTDIVQPAASDYSLAWSGNNGGYLKDPNNNAKYFVDDNATTFDAKLSYQGLNNVSLSTMNLKVESLLHSFADQDQNGNNISPTDVTSNTESRSYNQISPTLAYNAGAYNLSGTINLGNESTYKYAAFYDVVQLKPVDFTVKNTIKVGLYHSWNEDATSITEYTNGLPYIVGFKMPPVLPNNVDVNNSTVSPIVFTIDSNWKVQSSGLGVEANNGTYRLTSQTQTNNDTQYQRVHPRPNWNYKIQWESVVSNNLTPTLTNVNENKDIYFSYNGTITKNPSIATSISSDKLDIALDFYQTENENKPDGTTYNLDFTNDSFYLKATISQTDAAKYAGAQVNLQGEFTSELGGGHDAIHWWNSRQGGNSSIGYDNNNDGTGLRFTIQEGQTEYKIEWKFVRPNDSQSTDPVQFTYTVKNDLYNMTDDTNATIILGGNQAGGNELDITLNFSYDVDGNYNFTNSTSLTNLKLNTSRVRLTATISQENAQTYNEKKIQLNGSFSSNNSYGYNNSAIHWDNSRKGGDINYLQGVDLDGRKLEFTVQSGQTDYYIDWIFETGGHYPGYGDIEFTYNVTNSQGSGNQSATIAFTNEPVLEFMFNFNDNNDTSDDGKNKQLYGWFTTFDNTVVTNGERRFENNALVLHNEHFNVSNGIQESLSQAAVDVAFENGKSYTLIIKVKSDDQTTIYNNFSNNLPIILQDDNQNSNWPECGDFKTESNDDLTFSTEWQTVKVTTKANGTPTKGRVVINFGHIIGNIYIDDLILVRND